MRSLWKSVAELSRPFLGWSNPPQGMRGRMTHAVGWNTIATVFNQGSTFLINIILAHLLARRAFGQYAMIQTTLAVVASMAQLASGYTATKYVAEYRDKDPDRAGRILGLCAVVSIAMGLLATAALMLGAQSLASGTLNEPQLAGGLMIAGGVVFFSVMNGFLLGALAGLESYPALGKAGIVSGTLYVALCALGARTAGVNGALAGAALSALFQSLILWTLVVREAAGRHISIRWSAAWKETEIFLRFSIPAALSGFVSLPAIWLANALLAQQPHGYEQLALFSAANNFRIIVLFLPNTLNGVGMSVLNNQRGAGEEARFRQLFWANVAFTAAIVLIGGAAVTLSGRWLLGLFGREFQDAYPVLIVLMAAALAESLALAAYQSIQSHGRLWISFAGVAVPCYSALVIVASLLAPGRGAVGLAWAYVACWSVALAAVWLMVWRLGVWSSPARPRVV